MAQRRGKWSAIALGLLGLLISLALSAVGIVIAGAIREYGDEDGIDYDWPEITEETYSDDEIFAVDTASDPYVRQCLDSDSDMVLVRIIEAGLMSDCINSGTLFITGDVEVECFQDGDQDWSTSSCEPGMMAGSIEAALEACNQESMIHNETFGTAYCSGSSETGRYVIVEGISYYDVVTCYDLQGEAPVVETCSMSITMLSRGINPAAASEGLLECKAEVFAYNEGYGVGVCVNPGGLTEQELMELAPASGSYFSCYDPVELIVINCPEGIIDHEEYNTPPTTMAPPATIPYDEYENPGGRPYDDDQVA